MTDLDSCAEEAESERYMRSGQPCRAESTCESETMQQSERKSYEPWLALCESSWIRIFSKHFPRDKQDAEGNDCFNGCGRHVNESQRRQGQRDCV